MNKKQLYAVTALAIVSVVGVAFCKETPLVHAATGPAGVSVVANGATVSVTSRNAGALACTSYPSKPGLCNYLGMWARDPNSSEPSSDTFTITVTPPASKTIASWDNANCSPASTTCIIKDTMGDTTIDHEIVLTFSNTTPAPSPKPTPAPTPDPTKPSLTEPVKELTFNTYAYQADQKPSVLEGKPLVLGGKTFANGKVELTIHSAPRTATVTADANGVWTYTVNDLEAGDHRLEAKVTDPATGKTSELVQLASFSVMGLPITDAAKVPAASTQPVATSKPLLAVLSIACIVAAALIGGLAWFRSKKKAAHSSHGHDTPTPPAPPTTE
ncbi:MAG: Ig-like domain-containing protein [Candidatus Saccharimonadales bacterium]